jgi:hypothetical protein
MIIVFLAVTFIVVYLYYTIKDVKKISTEVQKLSKEVLALSQSISSITTTLINQAPVCYAPIATGVSVPQTVPVTSNIQVTVQDGTINDDESDDVDDLHQIIETIDDENTQAPNGTTDNVDISQLNTEDEHVASQSSSTEQELTKTTTKLDAKDLKSLSYETLKKYCKDNGIDAKGNKETLISKILAS